MAAEIETLKKQLQAPKPKEDTDKKPTEKKKEIAHTAFGQVELDAARTTVFDHVSKTQPVSVIRIAEHCDIPYCEVERVLDHEWFKKTKSGWRIAIKAIEEKGP